MVFVQLMLLCFAAFAVPIVAKALATAAKLTARPAAIISITWATLATAAKQFAHLTHSAVRSNGIASVQLLQLIYVQFANQYVARVMAIAVLLVVTVLLVATMSHAAKPFAHLTRSVVIALGMLFVQMKQQICAQFALLLETPVIFASR